MYGILFKGNSNYVFKVVFYELIPCWFLVITIFMSMKNCDVAHILVSFKETVQLKTYVKITSDLPIVSLGNKK